MKEQVTASRRYTCDAKTGPSVCRRLLWRKECGSSSQRWTDSTTLDLLFQECVLLMLKYFKGEYARFCVGRLCGIFFFLFVWSRNVQIYDKWWIDVEQFRKGEFPEYGARSECIGNLCRLSTVSEDNLTFHILLQKENQFDNDKMQGCLLTYMFLMDRSLHSW